MCVAFTTIFLFVSLSVFFFFIYFCSHWLWFFCYSCCRFPYFIHVRSYLFLFFFFFFLLYVCFHAFLLQLPNLTKLPFSFLAYLSFCHEFSRFSIASYVTSYRSIIIIPFTSSSLAFPFFFFFVLLVTVQNCFSLFNSTLDIVLLQSFVPSSPVLPESR